MLISVESGCQTGRASVNNLHMLYDPKQSGTLHSARWQGYISPDLCWVTTSDGHTLPAAYTVLSKFLHRQRHPSLIHVGLFSCQLSNTSPYGSVNSTRPTGQCSYCNRKLSPIDSRWKKFSRGVEEIIQLVQINNVERSYFTQLKYVT